MREREKECVCERESVCERERVSEKESVCEASTSTPASSEARSAALQVLYPALTRAKSLYTGKMRVALHRFGCNKR